MSSTEHEDPRKVLARYDLLPKRSFSQNFLVARDVVDKIAEAAVPAEGAFVVELGPGCGTLTTALLRRGAKVHAIERDRDMIRVLRTELAGVPDFEVEEGDASTVDLRAMAARRGEKLHLAGNLPYAITGEILRHLVESADALASAVVMVQREVRDRLLANPGDDDYGALTVFVQARMRVESVLLVRAGAFHPPPRVGSAVVRLVPMDPPRAEETPAFRSTVRAAFAQRRKMLRNALRAVCPDDAAIERACERAGVLPTARGETLSVERFALLARCLKEEAAKLNER